MRTPILVQVSIAVVLALLGCTSAEPVTPSDDSPVESSSTIRDVDTRMGLRIVLPAGWAVRADAPVVLAMWPDPFRPGSTIDPQAQPDGVIVIRPDYYLTTEDQFSGPDAFESARLRMQAKGYAPGAPFAVDLNGERAKAVRGTSGKGTCIVIVSPSYVVEAITENGAPASGLTTANVEAVLNSIGYIETPAP